MPGLATLRYSAAHDGRRHTPRVAAALPLATPADDARPAGAQRARACDPGRHRRGAQSCAAATGLHPATLDFGLHVAGAASAAFVRRPARRRQLRRPASAAPRQRTRGRGESAGAGDRDGDGLAGRERRRGCGHGGVGRLVVGRFGHVTVDDDPAGAEAEARVGGRGRARPHRGFRPARSRLPRPRPRACRRGRRCLRCRRCRRCRK